MIIRYFAKWAVFHHFSIICIELTRIGFQQNFSVCQRIATECGKLLHFNQFFIKIDIFLLFYLFNICLISFFSMFSNSCSFCFFQYLFLKFLSFPFYFLCSSIFSLSFFFFIVLPFFSDFPSFILSSF